MKWRAAIGEVFLIVVGIILALGATGLYESWAERKDELVALGELQSALLGDQTALAGSLEALKLAAARITDLRAHIEAGGEYADSLDVNFGAMYGLRLTAINISPY